MDLITTPVGKYTPAASAVVHATSANLISMERGEPVHLRQYDQTIPIIAVCLYVGQQPYTVPEDAAVNIRMKKPDGKHVYNPAKGVSEDRQIVYFDTTAQMTAAWGPSEPIVEIVIAGGVAGTAKFHVEIDENPIPEDAYESTDEYKTIQQLAVQVENAAKIVSDNETAINAVAKNIPTLVTVADISGNVSAVSEISEDITTVAKNAPQMKQVVDNLEDIQNAAENAGAAAASATQAESWAVGGTGKRAGEDTNNAKFWSEQAAQAANGYLGYFATQAVLQSAHPTANAGAWATVGETKTIWFWDGTQFVNSTPGATSSSAGIVTLQDAPNAAQTAANGYAASPAALLYDAPKQYAFVQGSASLSVPASAVTRGIIVTVRYGGNINQEITIVIPKDSAFETTTHRFYAALYLGTWRYVVVAANSGNLVLEYAGDGASLNETSSSFLKAEAF